MSFSRNIDVTLQEARDALTKLGWLPLVKIGDAEHWCKFGHRCILFYEGNVPEDASMDGFTHVEFFHTDFGELIPEYIG